MNKAETCERIKATHPELGSDGFVTDDNAPMIDHALNMICDLIISLRKGVPLEKRINPNSFCDAPQERLEKLAQRERDTLLFIYAHFMEHAPHYPYFLSPRDWDDGYIR